MFVADPEGRHWQRGANDCVIETQAKRSQRVSGMAAVARGFRVTAVTFRVEACPGVIRNNKLGRYMTPDMTPVLRSIGCRVCIGAT